jgi:Ca2+-binding RTX toxin-like protein
VRPVAAGVEALEGRALMAGSIWYYVDSGAVAIYGTSGEDRALVTPSSTAGWIDIRLERLDMSVAPSAVSYPAASLSKVTFYGYEGNDWFQNDTAVPTVAHGGADNDVLFGGGGADRLYGDAGHDFIGGNDGNDTIGGNDGNDDLFGGGGNDRVYGDAGADYFEGGDGNDLLWGGTEDDTITAGAGRDSLVGEQGNDLLRGGTGNDHLYGGIGNDSLYGEWGEDALMGEDGDDHLDGGYESFAPGASVDTLNGGNGQDTLVQHYRRRVLSSAGSPTLYYYVPEDHILYYEPTVPAYHDK